MRQIDSHDEAAFDAWYDVLRTTDEERWPGEPGWDRRTVKAMVDQRHGAMDFLCFSGTGGSGATVGIAMLQVPKRENRHQATLDVRVRPEHRRRGIGRALVGKVEQWATAADRTVLFSESEVPITALVTDASAPFARDLGFEAVQQSHRRHLALPPDQIRMQRLKEEVTAATVRYRTMAFTTPWPQIYVEDYCELQRRMSTDAPSGDVRHEEEVWNEARIKENDDLLADQGLAKVAAVAEHMDSGRLVAFSEIAVPRERPYEGWQWATLVRQEHRGHRLGLAVKLANLDYLGATFPKVRRIITGNAQRTRR